MSDKKLKQHGPKLRVGDIVRVLDPESAGDIAVCVESDGHPEFPYCCMVVNDHLQDRTETWPAHYVKLGNVNEVVGVMDVMRRRWEMFDGKGGVQFRTSLR